MLECPECELRRLALAEGSCEGHINKWRACSIQPGPGAHVDVHWDRSLYPRIREEQKQKGNAVAASSSSKGNIEKIKRYILL